MAKQKQNRVTAEFDFNKFVQIWETAESIDDVVKKLNWKRSTIQRWAGRMRKEGLKLKKFTGGGAGRPRIVLDIDALKKTLAKCQQKN